MVKKQKKELPRINFQVTEEMKKLVVIKCAQAGVTIKDAGIGLFYPWTQGKTKLPGEKK